MVNYNQVELRHLNSPNYSEGKEIPKNISNTDKVFLQVKEMDTVEL